MAFVLSLFSHAQLFETPGSSVHGILQARILGWAAISFSRALPRDQSLISEVSCTGRRVLHR